MRPNSRYEHVQPFDIDRVAAAADADPDILRMENLDTDLAPPACAVEVTRRAVGEDHANSWLPFTGLPELRQAVAAELERRCGVAYDADAQIVITSGGLSGVIPALFATSDAGDTVVLTDPVYAGLLQRTRLVSARPHLVPLRVSEGVWRIDREALRAAADARPAAVVMMSPSMPSGCVLDEEDWAVVAEVCERAGAWLIYDAAMERLLYDGFPRVHPCRIGGLADRTLIIGSMSKEYRMIGWRIGWVAGPRDVMGRIAQAVIYNTTVSSGFAQLGAAAALNDPGGAGVAEAAAEYQRRHDTVIAQLDGLPVVRAGGGWSCLVDAVALGMDAPTLSDRLLRHGRIAATPMTAWGGHVAPRYVRLVYSNEPVSRLAELRARFDAAL